MNDQGTTNQQRDGRRDFDFWMGSWRVANRKLRERLKGSTEWDEFEATCAARPILNGLGNEDEFRSEHPTDFVGMSFRYFNPATQAWSIYWADSRRGTLEPPVVGSFTGDTGTFLGNDTFEGRPIRVRFIWSRVNTANPRWEQAFSEDSGKTWETNWVMDMTRDPPAATDFPVVEFRRYTIKPGQREAFANYFESWFPEAFQQIGALALGQFFERNATSGFTWIRGFPNLDARATMNGAFYNGPLWKEHAKTLNDLMIDSDNVLLLGALDREHSVPVLPAVDPVSGAPGTRGVVVAHLFKVTPGQLEPFTQLAKSAFAVYRTTGVKQAGILVTPDAPNNFPRHPIRTDGPYLLWLGVLEDDAVLETRFRPLAAEVAKTLAAQGLLQVDPELIVLDPTRRSRLR